MRLFLSFILFFSLLVSASEKAKNVILLIGDGMGIAHVTMAHYAENSRLNIQRLPHTGFVTTHCADSLVTDSAAAGTALATGHKTNSGMISVTPDSVCHRTILEACIRSGKKTGLVTTTTISHATPACFASHEENRGDEFSIAQQLLEHEVDVMLGGGISYFLPKGHGGKRKDNRNLLTEAENRGYTVITERSQLINCRSRKLLGLFTPSYMNYELDRDIAREPALWLMAKKAVNLLDNDSGFFLMIEGGRIDHAAHGNDPASVLAETLTFDRAVGEALKFAYADGHTLVVVTADHETGGLGLSNGDYQIHPSELYKVKRSAATMAQMIQNDTSEIFDIFEKFAGISLSKTEAAEILASAPKKGEYSDGLYLAVSAVISKKAMTGWTTTSHSGTMVMVGAYGPGAELFSGFMDNTDIPVRIAQALEVEF